MNEAIAKMIREPGRYEVATLARPYLYSRVEVTPDGTVYQLNPKNRRDGVLRPDGWSADAVVLRKLE